MDFSEGPNGLTVDTTGTEMLCPAADELPDLPTNERLRQQALTQARFLGCVQDGQEISVRNIYLGDDSATAEAADGDSGLDVAADQSEALDSSNMAVVSEDGAAAVDDGEDGGSGGISDGALVAAVVVPVVVVAALVGAAFWMRARPRTTLDQTPMSAKV